MLLQRQYDGDGAVSHVVVKHTGASAEQNFSNRLVEQAVVDGWMSIDGDHLTVKTDGEPLVYDLKRTPGYYCTSTGERIPVSAIAWASAQRGVLARKEALRWLEAKGLPATDYEVTNAYECVLCDEHHDKFRAVIGPKGQVMAAHKLEG